MDPISLALLAAKAIPMISGWIGGDDAEDKATKVVSTIEAVTGLSGKTAIDHMAVNPDVMEAVQGQLLKEMAIYAKDRKNARDRDLEVRKISGSNWRADVLAIMSMVGLVALIWALLFINIPAGPARDILLVLSGALVAIVKDVYQFEFGSSRGSKEKNKLLG